MLRLIPPPLHRAGLRAAHAARLAWWRLARPRLEGAVIIALNQDGQVLLVRHSYGNGHWSLPGGGMRAGEDPATAAMREFTEELDCAIHALELAGVHESTLYGARVTRHVFVGEVVDIPRPDRREIAEARFFSLHELPEERSSLVDVKLAMIGLARD